MPMSQTFAISSMPSPIGVMRLVTDEAGRLRALDWDDHEERLHRLMRRQYPGRRIDLRGGALPEPVAQRRA